MQIDFHAHILPEADHGCTDLDMALSQLVCAKRAGIDVIAATSHFYPHLDTVDSFLHRRNSAFEKLLQAKQEDGITILPGAEVLLCRNMERMPALEKLCIGETKVLLLEMPLEREWEQNLVESVLRIRDQLGLKVVLAHAERYEYSSISRLVAEGIRVQLNTKSICSFKKRNVCRKYLEQDCVAAFGSDLHGIDHKYSDYPKAMAKLGKKADVIQKRTCELLGFGTSD